MQTITHEEQALEQYGPRDICWRQATDECLREARLLVYFGRHQEALHVAQDAWVSSHGSMHDIPFGCGV